MAAQFGPYRLEELIGRGGMGEVYRAFDTLRKRPVALKRLRPALLDEPEFEARYRAESQLAARLRSAHVIPIHDYGEIDGQLFIDMRLVDGEDMGQRLARRSRLAAADAVHVISQVAGALDAAHAAGLVHRDVKPSNVLLSSTDGFDGREFAYLVDFGIARAVDSTGVTASGHLVGTLDYMAPERFEPHAPDHRADVYSLACMLFEAMTGRKPFVSHSVAGLLYSHVNTPPPRPSALSGGVSPDFDAVVGRGMAKDPRERYPSAGALAAAAQAALAGSGASARPAPSPAPGPADPDRTPTVDLRRSAARPGTAAGDRAPARAGTGRRRRVVVGVAALAAAAATAAAVWVTGPAPAPPPTPDPGVMRVAGVLPITGLEVAVDPSGSRFYVGSFASYRSPVKIQVQAYDAVDSSLSGSIPLPDDTVEEMALSGDGRRLAVVTSTLPKPDAEPAVQLSVVELRGQTIARTGVLPGRITELALSGNG